MNDASYEWAIEEFAGVKLGDRRRQARLIKLAAAMARRPAGTVTAVLQDGAAREGAFRFLENDKVKACEIALGSHRATVQRCAGEPFVFVAVDQSTITVSDYQACKGFGPAGDGRGSKLRGAEVMSAMAVSASGTPLGLTSQRWWRRDDGPSQYGRHDTRALQERESDLWIQALESTLERFQEGSCAARPWFQLDRGGDFWRVFDFADEHGCWVTVRSAHDRRLWDQTSHLHGLIRRAPIRASIRTVLPARRDVGPAKRPKRNAILNLSYEPVTLEMLDDAGDYRQVELTVVRIKERSRRRDALEWILLTTYPVRSKHDARLVVAGYMQRWRIEDFHKTWKSGGCDVEKSQLRSAANFGRWATIQAAVAARTETLKHLSRTTPNVDAILHFTQTEIDAAIVLSETKKYRPGDRLTLQQVVWLVAQVGGYTGKSSGGPPGTTTIRRGLREVLAAATAVERLRKK